MRDYDRDDVWPNGLGFLPFVGRDYDSGLDGVRVLVLGVSHYGTTPDRQMTRNEFGECETAIRERNWSDFWKRLDCVLTRSPDPAPEDAAATWRHIAFHNFIQTLLPDASTRPSRPQWEEARTLLPPVVRILKPHVILVVGGRNWEEGAGEDEDDKVRIDVPGTTWPERSVRSMSYDGGKAVMTWIYHPSYWNRNSNCENVHTAGAVFAELLVLGRQTVAPAA